MKDLGPYEANEIYCGECSEMMSRLPDECIDLTVTSPPYDNLRKYNGFIFDYRPVIEQLYRVTKSGGVVVWVVADATIDGSETGTSFKQALFAMECGFNLHDTMVYWREGLPMTHNRYEQHFEYMFVFSKGAPSTFNPLLKKNKYAGELNNNNRSIAINGNSLQRDGRKPFITKKEGYRGNIWKYAIGAGRTTKDRYAFEHEAIFPEQLAHDHILSWSNSGDIVLDPFMGSGTTAKIAYQNGRKYLGFDISPEYVALAKKRVAWANPPLLVIG